MKKAGVLFIFLFIFLIFLNVHPNFIKAQDITENLDDFEEQVEEGLENVEETKQTLEERKWDYLKEEWTKFFTKNKYVAGMNSFLTKISIVFFVLVGEHYSFSWMFFFIIVLWVYFLLKFNEILTDYSSFTNTTSLVIALAFTIILAQFKVFKMVIKFFRWLIFSQESNIWRFLIMFIIFAVMIGIYWISSYMGDIHKKNKEKEEKEQEKRDRSFLRSIADILSKAFGQGEKKI
jgi:hypothetical protein